MARTKNISDSEVLSIARQVIALKGPESFTLEDISKKSGLSPATLIQRFGSKRKLLLETLSQPTETSCLEAHAASTRTGVPGLISYLAESASGIESERMDQQLTLLAQELHDPKLKKIYLRWNQEFRQRIERYLKEAGEPGKLHSPLDTPSRVLEIEALYHGLIIQWSFERSGKLGAWVRRGFERYFSNR